MRTRACVAIGAGGKQRRHELRITEIDCGGVHQRREAGIVLRVDVDAGRLEQWNRSGPVRDHGPVKQRDAARFLARRIRPCREQGPVHPLAVLARRHHVIGAMNKQDGHANLRRMVDC